MSLSEQDKKTIKACIDQGKPIPSYYRTKLFAQDDVDYVEATKDYRLVYKGKARKEDIIANTPAAPLQKIRSFNSDNPFPDGWQNMLIFGDNLLALKAIYEDQRGSNVFKTKNRIKLIYIDPPFATKQDFMKDREKVYRDKVIGAQFIEFLRKRLILLEEILADDGSIYVHLDWKKGHYIKAIMDEVFGEHNFLNNIVWCYKTRQFSKRYWNRKHEDILFYCKNKDRYFFNWDDKNVLESYSAVTIRKYKHKDERGYYRLCGRGIVDSPIRSAKDVDPEWERTHPELVIRDYLREGFAPNDYWNVEIVNQAASERQDYPTQKPEEVLLKVIAASSNQNEIVMDAFCGSGTTLAVAEKLGRRWIGLDCGKLSVYTTQKRILNLTTQVGPHRNDDTREYERVGDFDEHLKNSRGLLLTCDKARKGDLVVTDAFLKSLARFIEENLSGNAEQEFSLVCPEDKFQVEKLDVEENEEGKAGEKIVRVGRVRFLVSFIQPKEKAEKAKPLKAKEFALYNAGIYDQKLILDLEWEKYRAFVAQLFEVRLQEHKIYGFYVDGYIGTYPAYVWPYPNHKDCVLDKEYVNTLHKTLGGRAGDRLYVIAPVTAMAFMEDEVCIGKTTYVFLKVPLSVLMALIEKGEPGSLKQPVSEADVNEVIDAVGFDFISQPVVKAGYKRLRPVDKNLWSQNKRDYVIEIKEFRSDTLVYDPEDFENFETLSMVLVDLDYNDDYFNLSSVFWADSIVEEDGKKATIRIPQDDFTGKKMMVIFMDKYGNELKLVKAKREFKQ
jgi:DNA modification methylase